VRSWCDHYLLLFRTQSRLFAAVLALMVQVPIFAAPTAAELAAAHLQIADPQSAPGKKAFTAEDEAFLDDLTRRGVMFFYDEQNPITGLMPDRARAVGGVSNDVASVASVGFGLTSLCIGVERGWISRDDAYAKSLKVLKFLRDKAPQERGHFYHFLNMRTGERVWNCEVSNIDTAILMAGALCVRQYYPGTEAAQIADELYQNVQWDWMAREDGTLSMGWKPEKHVDMEPGATGDGGAFIKARWDHFNEGPLIYLLALGSKKHPLPAQSWQAWKRNSPMEYAGLKFMQCPPLFTHQYPWCWFDVRGQRDDHLNYFHNSQLATIAQRQWTIDELSKQFPTYGENMWGLTASDFAGGYTAFGGPPAQGPIDGTIVPCAAGGSLAFTPKLAVDALRHMKATHGDKVYRKYGFVDAFNPATGWIAADVLGIDVGATVLMAENARTGFVWKLFMSCPEAQAGLKAAGFRPAGADGGTSATTSIIGVAATEKQSR
jgi:hypothetical protein